MAVQTVENCNLQYKISRSCRRPTEQTYLLTWLITHPYILILSLQPISPTHQHLTLTLQLKKIGRLGNHNRRQSNYPEWEMRQKKSSPHQMTQIVERGYNHNAG